MFSADRDRVLSSSRRFDLFGRLCSEEGIVEYCRYVAYLFGGAFLLNAVPHFLSGVCTSSGHHSPPLPARESISPTVNVRWGPLHLAIGHFLARRAGGFDRRQTSSVAAPQAGGLWMAVMLSRTLGRVYSAPLRGERGAAVGSGCAIGARDLEIRLTRGF